MTPRWREMDSNFWYRGTKAVDFRAIALEAATGLDRYALAHPVRHLAAPLPDRPSPGACAGGDRSRRLARRRRLRRGLCRSKPHDASLKARFDLPPGRYAALLRGGAQIAE